MLGNYLDPQGHIPWLMPPEESEKVWRFLLCAVHHNTLARETQCQCCTQPSLWISWRMLSSILSVSVGHLLIKALVRTLGEVCLIAKLLQAWGTMVCSLRPQLPSCTAQAAPRLISDRGVLCWVQVSHLLLLSLFGVLSAVSGHAVTATSGRFLPVCRLAL